jgi:hypothetical protein
MKFPIGKLNVVDKLSIILISIIKCLILYITTVTLFEQLTTTFRQKIRTALLPEFLGIHAYSRKLKTQVETCVLISVATSVRAQFSYTD